jgi:hypothetical protein
MFAALENLDDDDEEEEEEDDDVDMIRARELIRESVKTATKENLRYCELKQHKPLFEEKRSKLLDHRKQAKLQWLQNSSEMD